MATIKEVAARAGVSTGTVSHVLGGVRRVQPQIRQRVEAAIRELNYRPNHAAQSLKSKRTRALGMVISDITNPFFPELVRGAEQAALERGYLLTTFNSDDRPERERQIFDVLQARRMDGYLVVVALERGEHPHVARAIEAGIPVVCLDRRPQDLAVDSVTVDNAAGVACLVEHVITQGYRDIVYLGGAPQMYLTAEREAGYRRSMAAAQLPLRKFDGDFRRDSGFQLVHQLRSAWPQAIVTANILMAGGVLEGLGEAGRRVPQDVALATFDAISILRGFHPQLTAFAQPSYDMGYRGATLLMDRVERKAGPEPVHEQLQGELVLGESTPARL
jgi:LacI family transcriptional regulator